MDNDIVNAEALSSYHVANSNSKSIITLRLKTNPSACFSVEFNKDFISEHPYILGCSRNIISLYKNIIYITLFERTPNGKISHKITHGISCVRCSLPMEMWNCNPDINAQYLIKNLMPLLKRQGAAQFTPWYCESDNSKGIYRYAIDINIS